MDDTMNFEEYTEKLNKLRREYAASITAIVDNFRNVDQ